MSDPDERPALQIAVQLAPRLLAHIEETAGRAEILSRVIAATVDNLLEQLGLPGKAAVALSALAEESGPGQFLRLSVGGVPYRYPDRLLARVHSRLTAAPLQPPDLERIAAWLEAPDGPDRPDRLLRYLATVCPAILARDPSRLLAQEQLDAYFSASFAADLPPDTLLEILRELLRRRLSLRNREQIAGLIHSSAAAGSSPAEIAEALIAALRPGVVIVTLPPADLQQMRALLPEESLFVLMRDGLFYELGMRYPDFRLVPDPDLPPRSFAVQINDLVGLPWAGLSAGEMLANESVERLRLLGIDAAESQNPANDNEAALIAEEQRPGLEAAGVTTWDALGYLILCLSAELREASAALFDRNLAADLLYQLGELFPALNDALNRRFSLDFITRVLRRLLAEQMPIRNLRHIAEAMLSFEEIAVDSRRYIVFDDRFPVAAPLSAPVEPEMMAAYVRTRMKQTLSHRLTQGQNTLPVYLLALEVEEALASDDVEPALVERLLAAIREESGGNESAFRPALLTDASLRARLQALTGAEFPHLPVVAYQELSPALNLQPLARLEVTV